MFVSPKLRWWRTLRPFRRFRVSFLCCLPGSGEYAGATFSYFPGNTPDCMNIGIVTPGRRRKQAGINKIFQENRRTFPDCSPGRLLLSGGLARYCRGCQKSPWKAGDFCCGDNECCRGFGSVVVAANDTAGTAAEFPSAHLALIPPSG